jgi:hypothetical protein
MLVAAAVIIVAVGLTKLSGPRRAHGMPWGSLLVWAVLFGAGLLMWLVAVGTSS